MRVKLLQAVALVSVTLTPLVGEASSITGSSLIPDITTAGTAVDSEHSSGEPRLWPDPSLTSLFDESGDSLLLISPSNAFEHFADQNKLRTERAHDSCSGGCSGSGGLGLFGGLNLFSIIPEVDPGSIVHSQDLDLHLDLDLGLDLPGGCCECNECGGGTGQTVPEPSMFMLAAAGLAMGIRRVAPGMRTRR